MQPNREEELSKQIESLTVHGVSRIKSANTKRGRVFWTSLCIFAILSFLYFINDIIWKHLKKEVYVKTHRQVFQTGKLPAITFCNSNFLDSYPDPAVVFQELPENCSLTADVHFKNKRNKEYFAIGCQLFLANLPVFTARLSKTNSETFRFPKMFSLLPSFWPCFTLNRKAELKQSSSGKRDGLHMVLYHDQHAFKGDKFSYDPLGEERQGLYVNIHDHREHIREFGGVLLPAGYHTHIKIRKIVKLRKPSPFPSKCVHDGKESYEKIIPGKHIITNCFYAFLEIFAYHKCNGVQSYMRVFMPVEKYPKNASYGDLKYLECADKVSMQTIDSGCQLPCYEEIYETQVNRQPWPQDWQADTFASMVAVGSAAPANNVTLKDIKSKLVRLSIFYEDLATEVHEEKELYTLSNIVSDMGGQLGLFLGASCLSLVEVSIILWNCVNGRFRKKAKTHPEDSLDAA